MGRAKRFDRWKYLGLSAVWVGLWLTLGYFTPRQWGGSRVSCAQAEGLRTAQANRQIYLIYLEGNIQHVNLLLPVANDQVDWNQFLAPGPIGAETGVRYQYLKFGWGDRDFYRNTPSMAAFQLPKALHALLAPGNVTTVHVQGYPSLPIGAGAQREQAQDQGEALKCVALTGPEYRRLAAFIQASFQQTAQHPIRIQDGFTPSSGFYEGTGHYSILRTCNTWAAEGLDAAGVTTPLWTALAPAVWRQIP
jgi:uncharacterized protein (TIGR02117 family)